MKWETMHMNAVFPAQNIAVLSAVIVHQLEELEDEGPMMLQSRNSEADHKQWSESVGVDRPTDQATSIEFANLLTKVAPDTQSLRVSAPGLEMPRITLTLKKKQMTCLFAPYSIVRRRTNLFFASQ